MRNHHHNLILENFYHPKKPPHVLCCSWSLPLPPSLTPNPNLNRSQTETGLSQNGKDLNKNYLPHGNEQPWSFPQRMERRDVETEATNANLLPSSLQLSIPLLGHSTEHPGSVLAAAAATTAHTHCTTDTQALCLPLLLPLFNQR